MTQAQKTAMFRPLELLQLPAELRLEIYRLVGRPKSLRRNMSPLTFSSNRFDGRISNLLRSCKQVHSEAKAVLYEHADFYLCLMTLYKEAQYLNFEQPLSGSHLFPQLDQIRSLSIELLFWQWKNLSYTGLMPSWLKFVSKLSALRTLTLVGTDYIYRPVGLVDFERGVKDWRKHEWFGQYLSDMLQSLPLSVSIVCASHRRKDMTTISSVDVKFLASVLSHIQPERKVSVRCEAEAEAK